MKTRVFKKNTRTDNRKIKRIYVEMNENGSHKYKSLNMYEFCSPRTPQERKHNADVKSETESIINEYSEQKFDDTPPLFFECIDEFGNPKITHPLKRLLSFLDSKIVFMDVTEVANKRYINALKNLFQCDVKNKTYKGNYKQLKGSTYANYWCQFKIILRKCYPAYIDEFPKYFGTLKYKQSTKSQIVYSDDDLKALWKTPVFDLRGYHKIEHQGVQVKRACFFMLYTGLRAIDIIKLDWKSIHRVNDDVWNVVIIQEKTKNRLVNSFPSKARRLLGQRLKGRVFRDLQGWDYKHAYRSRFYDRFMRWRDRAGVSKEKTLHTFRHTYATKLYNSCGNIYEVSKALGHKSIETTEMFYAPAELKTNENAMHIENAYSY